MFHRQRKRTTMNELTPRRTESPREIPAADLRLVTGGMPPGGGPLCSWTAPTDPDGLFLCDDD